MLHAEHHHSVQAWLGTPNINKCFVGVTLMQHLAAAKPELARIRQPANGNILESIRFQARWGRHRLGLYRSPHKLSTAVPEGLQVNSEHSVEVQQLFCRCRRGGWSGAP